MHPPLRRKWERWVAPCSTRRPVTRSSRPASRRSTKRFESDMDGHFTLKPPPGTYELRISAPYQPAPAGGQGEGTRSRSRASRSPPRRPTSRWSSDGRRTRLPRPRSSWNAGSRPGHETVSAEVIKKTPDKDAASIVKRVSRVTIKDDRSKFIRGLGERYSGALLNESRLPSTDPSRRVVPSISSRRSSSNRSRSSRRTHPICRETSPEAWSTSG